MLQRLILLRHGEAVPRAPSGRDLDRPLSEAGRAAAAEAGGVLRDAGIAPDIALVSPALRTRRTWEAARVAWPDAPPDREEPGLYDETPARLLKLAEAAGEAAVALVAHNPGLQALAVDLALDDARLAAGFPPATVAVLDRGEGGTWSVALFHTPSGAR